MSKIKEVVWSKDEINEALDYAFDKLHVEVSPTNYMVSGAATYLLDKFNGKVDFYDTAKQIDKYLKITCLEANARFKKIAGGGGGLYRVFPKLQPLEMDLTGNDERRGGFRVKH